MHPGWYRAGHAHGALAVLRVCQLPSMSHVARCQVPSTARAPLDAFATMVLATLGDFVDEPALSKEQIILATLQRLPTSFGGLGFQQLMAYLLFLPYAASVVLALAVLRERGIDLNSVRVTEATPIITGSLGAKNMSGAPGVMILERPVRELKKLSARMFARFHESRIALLTRQLVERPCPQHDVWLHMILEHSTQLSGAWLSTIPREYISLLPNRLSTSASAPGC